MSTLYIAAIVIGTIVAIFYLLITIHNKNRRKAMNNMLRHFSLLASEHNLAFSSQEVFKNCILGLDGMRRKVLIVTREGNLFGSSVINLEEVKSCTVKKVFGSIKADDLNNKPLDQYLESIVVHFEFTDHSSKEIKFYDHFVNHIYESQELEQKARSWEIILSKMLTAVKKIA